MLNAGLPAIQHKVNFSTTYTDLKPWSCDHIFHNLFASWLWVPGMCT